MSLSFAKAESRLKEEENERALQSSPLPLQKPICKYRKLRAPL
jgi:hypothetical protein